jgi:prepilin-type N-terminal cleavage/methylation domain-containing protein
MAYNAQGFTIIELIVVLVIIGILITLGLPSYHNIKEKALDKEAIVNLKLIQAAEKIYRMEIGGYYDSVPPPPDEIRDINDWLKIDLLKTATRIWDYATDGAGTATATRTSSGPARTWTLPINQEDPQ